MSGKYPVQHLRPAFSFVYGGGEAGAPRSLDILRTVIQEQDVASGNTELVEYAFVEREVRLRDAQEARVELPCEARSIAQHLGHVACPPGLLIAGNVAGHARVLQNRDNAHHFIVNVDRVQRAQGLRQVICPVPPGQNSRKRVFETARSTEGVRLCFKQVAEKWLQTGWIGGPQDRHKCRPPSHGRVLKHAIGVEQNRVNCRCGSQAQSPIKR